MAKILVQIEAPDKLLYFIIEYEQFNLLINKLNKDQVQFGEMPASLYHWLKGEEWCVPFYVVLLEEFPTEYVKEFNGTPDNPLQDS